MKNNRVYVSGEVKYGDQIVRVSSEGIIEKSMNNESLATLDNVDGDGAVTVLVMNKYIKYI